MEQLSMKGTTKRGNEYNRRRTKLADGMTRTNADQPQPGYSDDALSLMVNGTTDRLKSWHFKISTRTKHHPIDPAYTKRVKCLSNFGKTRLSKLRRLKAARG